MKNKDTDIAINEIERVSKVILSAVKEESEELILAACSSVITFFSSRLAFQYFENKMDAIATDLISKLHAQEEETNTRVH